LEVFQRAQTTEQLTAAILEKRHEYRHLRVKMRDLAEILDDPSLATDDYFRLVNRWHDQWEYVANNAINGTMGLGQSSVGLLAHGIEIATALEEEHYVGAALSVVRLFKDTRQLLRRRLFRPVHYAVRNYIQGGHRGMVKAVARFFDMDVRSAHQQLALVASTNSVVWRTALAGQEGRKIAAVSYDTTLLPPPPAKSYSTRLPNGGAQ
jgi:hypothetical protein